MPKNTCTSLVMISYIVINNVTPLEMQNLLHILFIYIQDSNRI